MSQTRPRQGGVYIIRNNASGKIYIGSAVRFDKRWYEHRRLLKAGQHKNRHLQSAWRKYGEASFEFSMVEIVDGGKEEIIAAEQRYLDSVSGAGHTLAYNINVVATSRLGVKASAETSAKIGLAKIGNKNRLGALIPRDVRDRISAKLTGRKIPREHVEKSAAARRGRPQSPEHIAARVASRKARGNYRMSDEQKRAISETLKGRSPNKEGVPHAEDTLG